MVSSFIPSTILYLLFLISELGLFSADGYTTRRSLLPSCRRDPLRGTYEGQLMVYLVGEDNHSLCRLDVEFGNDIQRWLPVLPCRN